MKNRIQYFVLIVVSIGIGIVLGMYLKTNPLATIEVSNASTKVVQSVNITVGMTSYVVGNIEQNRQKVIKVFVAGEAGYSIKVSFTNGDTLVNWNYVETGNKLNETILDTGIVSTLIHR